MPQAKGTIEVVEVDGNHGLKKDVDSVAAAVRGWLPRAVS
jgi:hypothetical protein